MLYSFDLMMKVCDDVLPFNKDINNLICGYILTSDSISTILNKKIKDTKKQIITNIKKREALYESHKRLPRHNYQIEEIKILKLLCLTIEKLNNNNKKLKNFKYTLKNGINYDYNYFKLKSKMEEKIETEEDLKYIRYLYNK